MKITYDKSVNAVYIYLMDSIPEGAVKKTYQCDPAEVGGMINLDFDGKGLLLGIEVLDANKQLSANLLEKAEIVG